MLTDNIELSQMVAWNMDLLDIIQEKRRISRQELERVYGTDELDYDLSVLLRLNLIKREGGFYFFIRNSL